MAGITDTQSIRYGHVTDVISHTMLRNEADDIAAQLDAADVAATAALKLPAAIVRRGATLAVPVSSLTAVPFDDEQQDTHAMVDLATQPTRITAGATAGAGLYMVAWQVQWDTTGWMRGDVVVNKNGAYYARQTLYTPQSFDVFSGCLEIHLGTVGDYVSFSVFHEGGGTTNLFEMYAWAWKVANN